MCEVCKCFRADDELNEFGVCVDCNYEQKQGSLESTVNNE